MMEDWALLCKKEGRKDACKSEWQKELITWI